MNGSFSLRFVFYRLVLGISLSYGMPATAVDWTITNLGTLGGDSYAFDINARGQVVGYSFTSGDVHHAFLFDGTMRDLGTLEGPTSEAFGINIHGQVVGNSDTSVQPHAFLFDGVMRDLGTLGGEDSVAFSINARGQVVGESTTNDDLATHAFLYDGAMRDLGTLEGATDYGSTAFDINDRGQVVGWSEMISDPVWHAFLFDGVMRDLGTLAGTGTAAYSINARGQVVGWGERYDVPARAFLYDGVMRDLGTLGGTRSWAYGINVRGQVVGASNPSGDVAVHAFLHDGAMRDLSTLPEVAAAGWQSLDYAGAINDSGQIVGAGVIGGQTRAFRLHPQTTSRYMRTVDPATLFILGCEQTNQSGLLILDFGSPRYNGTDYGTSLFQGFAAISSIESAVRYFLNGYYVCGGRGFMTVAVGTTSHGSQVTSEHGAAWGEMMTRLNNYISNYRDRLAVVGAIDIELDVPDGWATPLNARAWVDGYASTSLVSYYNYGDAQGCPTTGTGPCDNGWTQQDVWYVSWGSPANPLPVPEIYYNAPPGPPTHAQRWATLATLYSANPMFIPGVLTEWQACRDPNQSCAPGYNAPVQAWQQMMDALHAVTPDPTAVLQSILYSSDITWQN